MQDNNKLVLPEGIRDSNFPNRSELDGKNICCNIVQITKLFTDQKLKVIIGWGGGSLIELFLSRKMTRRLTYMRSNYCLSKYDSGIERLVMASTLKQNLIIGLSFSLRIRLIHEN